MTTATAPTPVDSGDSVPEALAAGLLGIDAARRVGWAKAFAALDQVDTISEDLRQTRDELKWLRRSYSRLLGFVTHLPAEPSDRFKLELAAHLRAESTFRDEGAWTMGATAAFDHMASLLGWSEEERAAKRQEHDEARRALIAATREKREREAAKARRDAEQSAKKQRVRLLIIEARSMGHDVDAMRSQCGSCGTPTKCQEAKCSCGATSGVLPDEDIVVWRRDHCAQVLYGMTFSQWMGTA